MCVFVGACVCPPGQSARAAAGHVDEGGGAGAGLQRGLDAPQQVVGLQQQQHLTGHAVQQLADLGEVEGRVGPDLHVLRHTHTHTHTHNHVKMEWQ